MTENGTNGASVVDGRQKRFTTEEKLAMIADLRPGESVVAQAARLGVSPNTLFIWRRKLGAPGATEGAEPDAAPAAPVDSKKWRAKVAALEAEVDGLRSKVNDLERMLGRKTVELETLRDEAQRARRGR